MSFARSETDRYKRSPSPAVARRSYSSHQPRGNASYGNTFNDDYFLDPRLYRRDPSPGDILDRLSTSAPSPGRDMPSFHSRPRYRDTRRRDCVDGYVTSASPSRMRGTSPASYGRMTSPSHNFYVNGDAAPFQSSARFRPRSFPEQRGGPYFSDPPPGHYSQNLHPGNHVAVSKRRELPPGLPYAATNANHAGTGQRFNCSDEVSPNSDDVASGSSATAVILEGSSRGYGTAVGEMGEGSFTCDDGFTWHSALTCYLCGQFFCRPRILPCGHTFCSECLAQLKDESLRSGRRSPSGSVACTWEGRHKVDAGMQLVCPMPDCRYSMRLMNLSRWSTRNKTVTEAVTALRRMYESRQDAGTQTDITMESMLVTIPRSLIEESPLPGNERCLVRRNSSSVLDRMVHRALSMDSLSRSYIPQQHVTWRSYAAMLGMHILQQVIHT